MAEKRKLFPEMVSTSIDAERTAEMLTKDLKYSTDTADKLAAKV